MRLGRVKIYTVGFSCKMEGTALELGEVLKEDDHKCRDILRCFRRRALWVSL